MNWKLLFSFFFLLLLFSNAVNAQTILNPPFITSSINGDCTITGFTIICTKTNGVAFAASATTNALNASNISSGTLPAARLPNPSASTLGGVQSFALVTNQFLTSISTSGVPAAAQPAFTNLSGTLGTTQMVALTGDVTNSTGAVATVVGKVNGVTFPASPSTHQVPVVTAANTTTYKTIPDCPTGALQYTQSTDTFACGAASSGGLVKISTQTASSSATLQWTGLATYDIYKLTCNAIVPVTTTTTNEFTLQFGTGGGPTWTTSGYESQRLVSTASTTTSGNVTSQAALTITATSIDPVIYGLSSGTLNVEMTAYNMVSTVANKQLSSNLNYRSNINGISTALNNGYLPTVTAAITGIRVLFSTGNISSGSCTLYGFS